MSAGYYYVGSYYVDLTTPSAPVLYRCTTAGTKTTSVWGQVSGGGGSGWNYRGVFNPLSTYAVNDAVLLGAGTSAGLYLSTLASNTNSPDSGIGWVQLSSYATWL
jgi:hypothetical protein